MDRKGSEVASQESLLGDVLEEKSTHEKRTGPERCRPYAVYTRSYYVVFYSILP
jgi:hypothetical protein